MPASQGLQVCTYKELGVRDGSSPSIACDTETANVRRQLLIPWPYIQTACAQLVGYSAVDSSGNLTRWLPQQDPIISGLFATRINQAQGIGWRDKYTAEFGSTNLYELACVDVDFEPRPYAIIPDTQAFDPDPPFAANEFRRFTEVVTSPEGEYLSIPPAAAGGTATWVEGTAGGGGKGSTYPGNAGRIISTVNYTFKWYQIPDEGLPEFALRSTVGKTNKKDFGKPDDLKFFWPAGTLLMIGAGWRRTWQFTPGGVKPAWYVEMMVKYNPKGHSRLFNFKDPVTPDWYQVGFLKSGDPPTYYPPGSVPDGKLIYDEKDYAPCFEMET